MSSKTENGSIREVKFNDYAFERKRYYAYLIKILNVFTGRGLSCVNKRLNKDSEFRDIIDNFRLANIKKGVCDVDFFKAMFDASFVIFGNHFATVTQKNPSISSFLKFAVSFTPYECEMKVFNLMMKLLKMKKYEKILKSAEFFDYTHPREAEYDVKFEISDRNSYEGEYGESVHNRVNALYRVAISIKNGLIGDSISGHKIKREPKFDTFSMLHEFNGLWADC